MFNVGFPEIFVVTVLALLVFGPERLPELARNTAKFVNRFRTEASRSIADLREAADLGDLEREVRSIRGDLAGVRDEITRGVREPADALRNANKPVSPGGPSAAGPDEAPGSTPYDPEAT